MASVYHMSHPTFAQNRPTRRLSKSGTLFIDRLSPEFAPVPLKIQALHARLLITSDEFLYPLRGVRHPCYRICHLFESFHSSFSSEWNRLKNPPQRLFLPHVRQKAQKFRVGRVSACGDLAAYFFDPASSTNSPRAL
jgi:hypothetical protein